MQNENQAQIKHEYDNYLDECWLNKQTAVTFEEWERLYNNGELYLLD